MTDAEVYGLVKLIRGQRQSPPPGVPFASWPFGNLRLVDPNEFLPKLDLVSRRERGAPVRLDVVSGNVLLEQWRIVPGTSSSDASSLSLMARSILLYVRMSELYAEIVHRPDVDVVVGTRAVLPDDSSRRIVWDLGADGTTVQVVVNESWRTALLERDSHRSATPSNDSLLGPGPSQAAATGGGLGASGGSSRFALPLHTPGSGPSAPGSHPSGVPMATTPSAGPDSARGGPYGLPRATPPLAPQGTIAGSFGTSPRVGHAAAIGSFVLPQSQGSNAGSSSVGNSPAVSFARPPPAETEAMPTLVPIAATTSVDHTLYASPTSANPPKRSTGMPFGIGTSTFDLDTEGSGSPHTIPSELQQTMACNGDATGLFPADADADPVENAAELTPERQRQDVMAFLAVVQNFHPRISRVAGVPPTSSADALALLHTPGSGGFGTTMGELLTQLSSEGTHTTP